MHAFFLTSPAKTLRINFFNCVDLFLVWSHPISQIFFWQTSAVVILTPSFWSLSLHTHKYTHWTAFFASVLLYIRPILFENFHYKNVKRPRWRLWKKNHLSTFGLTDSLYLWKVLLFLMIPLGIQADSRVYLKKFITSLDDLIGFRFFDSLAHLWDRQNEKEVGKSCYQHTNEVRDLKVDFFWLWVCQRKSDFQVGGGL